MPNNGNIFQLRDCLPQDIAAMITWPQSITEARWWAGPQTRWPIPMAVVQAWHADPEAQPYILCQGSTRLAYGELWIDGREQEVELARLIVAPEHRGQGVCGVLVRLLLEEARRTPYARAFLRVFPDNHVATNCYLRAGFALVRPTEQQAFNQGQATDYLWMSYLLDPYSGK